MNKTSLPLIVIAATAFVACGPNLRRVEFSDGSVLTAKERVGDSFREVRIVRKDGSILKAGSATILKDRLVLTKP
jgi:hypothetical protein